MARDIAGIDIQYIKGVGPRKAALLRRLGIKTVRDAIFHFPTRYEDRRDVRKIRDLSPGGCQTVVGRIRDSRLVELRRGRGLFGQGRRPGGLKLLEITVSDETGEIKAKWFNQPYLKSRLQEGRDVVLSGPVKLARRGIEMDNPDFDITEDADDALLHSAGIVPVYGATEGLSPRQVRAIVSTALKEHAQDIEDPMPPDMTGRLGLPDLRESVVYAHLPPPDADIDALNLWGTASQKRISFDELFMLEAGFAVLRKDKERERGISFASDGAMVRKLLESLPFKLTGAQARVFFDEILKDMESPYCMNRMLQGDVGSGKTVVALMALLSAIECGYQGAIMAPTEILAEQHYMSIHRMVEALGLRICLLTGSVRERPTAEISGGRMDIVVGTHALIQEEVRFKKLGLVVIDEQHRFGVLQRAELRKKALNPDVLIMTATPIPRTLALTLYGDLDYSVIRELPPGRLPVRTELFTPDRKDLVYGALEAELGQGGQAYVVYPVIEGAEEAGLKSAVLGEEAMKRVFPRARVGLMHGRMKPAEKEAVMEGFKGGDIDILVCTTVVEVGVDVPNASLMVVVHAERFGLSQLHQLRGRVGRGARPSRCILLAYGPLGEEAANRLDVMCRTTDGFELAEEDLRLRGPGEFLGTRQSGLPGMKNADILRDADLLEPARREAFALVERDPSLDGHPALRARLEAFWSGKVELFKTG